MPICQLPGRFVVLFYCLFVVKFGLLRVGKSVSRRVRAAHRHGRMPGLFPKVPGEKTKVLTVFPKVRIVFTLPFSFAALQPKGYNRTCGGH